MHLEVLRFKLLKLAGIYKKQGAKASLQFLFQKLNSKIKQRLFYKTFHQTEVIDEAKQQLIQKEIVSFTHQPLISVVMPVYNVDEKWLTKAINSVRNQLYTNWELCIANDASTATHIKPILDEYAQTDSRIKVIHRTQSGNISAASNSAIELVTGTYIALLDNDDELTIDALYEVAKLINHHPDAGIIYSDEDKINEDGTLFNPWFKPDWSPEYLLSHMYVCHLTVYQTALVKQAGGFRSEFDGAQDYDLCLRISRLTNQIYHIPKILYHWRTLSSSTAANPLAKKHAYEAGRKAVEEHIRSYNQAQVSESEYHGIYKSNFSIDNNPKVSIIIPSAGKVASPKGKETCLLVNCLQQINTKSTYKNIEVIVVDGNDIPQTIIEQCENLGAKFIHVHAPFNFSERINKGAAASTGEYLLLLNDDTEVISHDWIEQLLGFAQQENIGAVGAKLLTANNQIQHAGIILVDGSPAHIHYGLANIGQGPYNALSTYKNYLAVTAACLMVKKSVFVEAGMMDENFPVNFNDVDLCLALHQKGLRNVFNPFAELYHYESISRGKGYKAEELAKFIRKWENYQPALNDPYYHPMFVKYPNLLA